MTANSSTSNAAGTLILVTGPSGVGKDSLLGGAQEFFRSDARLQFATRVITRPSSVSGEQHVSVTYEQFRDLKNSGAFWIDWHAHDTHYALPIELHASLTAGVSVLANISRTVIATLATRWENTVVVEINANAERVRQRLTNRARENQAQINQRLARTVPPPPASVTLHKVDNSGTLETGIQNFTNLLTSTLAAQSINAQQPGSSHE